MFGQGAKHLLGRLTGGKVIEFVRIEGFNEVYPAGAAGGDHGQGAAGLQSLEQLVAFLENSEVSGEVGMENIIKAKHFEPSHEFQHIQRSSRHSHCFRYRYSNCRGDLGKLH